jgi:diadenosine tetraphosphatase ApaH/serine/threonine PP2A family protein phosphatase
MKWALLSDIHGNLEAFQAVIEDFRICGAERVAFLGDVVGYGADPNACVEILRDIAHVAVAGNHDYGAVGLTDVSYFNSAAKSAILWTGRKLQAENRTFLRELPLLRRIGTITFAHATPFDPGEWSYIFTYPEAEAAFQAMAGELGFIGHTHQPQILSRGQSGSVKAARGEEVTLEEGLRYIINVGSVGQPRDGSSDAAYGLYDDESKKYLLKRVPYDILTAKKKIIRAGLPAALAHRLSEGS